MSNTSRITSKGQVTIPQSIRESLHLLPHTEVEFTLKDGNVILKKVATKKGEVGARGKQLIDSLRGKGSIKMSTDEILALTRK